MVLGHLRASSDRCLCHGLSLLRDYRGALMKSDTVFQAMVLYIFLFKVACRTRP